MKTIPSKRKLHRTLHMRGMVLRVIWKNGHFSEFTPIIFLNDFTHGILEVRYSPKRERLFYFPMRKGSYEKISHAIKRLTGDLSKKQCSKENRNKNVFIKSYGTIFCRERIS